MLGNVKISNIDELSEHVAKIYALLAAYKETCEEEYRNLAVLDFEVSDCMQFVQSRKTEYETALDQTGIYSDNSETAQENIRYYKQKISNCENNLSALNKCTETIQDIRSRENEFVNTTTKLSDEGRLLAAKIRALLSKYKDAK